MYKYSLYYVQLPFVSLASTFFKVIFCNSLLNFCGKTHGFPTPTMRPFLTFLQADAHGLKSLLFYGFSYQTFCFPDKALKGTDMAGVL